MAFRMNRPIIKGTANHKASVVKATKQSIVSQARTTADAGLIAASNALGKSYVPKAIDFELDKVNIDIPEKKEKKEKQPKVKKSKSDYGDYEEYLAEEKELQKNIDDKDYQAYLDQESGSGTSDENLPSREQWEKNLKKPSYKPLSKKDWTDLNVEAGMKRPKVKKEKKVKVKKEKEPKVERDTWRTDVDKDGNVISRGWQSIRDKIKARREQKELDSQNERLKRAEEGPDSDYDFSQIDNEPSAKTNKAEKYKSPEASTKEGEELLSRTKAGRNKALQEAAKKYNVKVEDLEAKEIGGKREFFPKQGVQGGSYILTEKELRDSGQVDEDGNVIEDKGTKWDDELGRFRVPTGGISDEALANLSDEDKKVYEAEMEERAKKQEAEAQALKPKIGNVNPDDVNSTMINEGQIELDPVTNTYKYTDLYHKTKAIIAETNQPKVVEPVVEENKTTTPDRKPRPSDFEGTWKQRQEQYKIANEKWYQAQQEKKGKSPMEMRDNRIYRNAIKGGVVQQNMIKSGYKPE